MKWLMLFLILATAGTAYGQLRTVSFASEEQTVFDSQDVTIEVRLSEISYFPVVVPFSVNSAATSLPEDQYYFVDEEQENPLIFEPGDIVKTIVYHIDKYDSSENYELVIDMDTANVTVAQSVAPTTHTIHVINQPVEVSFAVHEGSFEEDGLIAIGVRLSRAVNEDILIPYRTDFTYDGATASSTDILTEGEDGSFTTSSPITMTAGQTYVGLILDINNDDVVNDPAERVFRVYLGAEGADPPVANFEDSGVAIPVETEPYTVTIVDNDPITVGFTPDEGADDPLSASVREDAGYAYLDIGLSSRTDQVVTLTYTVAGSATEGEEGDYTIPLAENQEERTLTIDGGEYGVYLPILLANDDDIEDDETVIVTLTSATLADETVLALEEGNTVFTLTVTDNDPISLEFMVYDEDEGDYVPVTEAYVFEADGTATFMVRLSGGSEHDVDFTLSMNQSQTTATILDPDPEAGEQEGWDVYLSSSNFADFVSNGFTKTFTIFAGYASITFQMTLNDDVELPYSVETGPGADVEPIEFAVFEISNVTSEEGAFVLGDASTYQLGIIDMADIDISDYFDISLIPDPVTGNDSVLNPYTGLHTIKLHFEPNRVIDSELFAGYKSLKIRPRVAIFDVDNPNSETNDPVGTSPANPEENEEFVYLINNPHRLGYRHGVESLEIIEGTEPAVEGEFTEENASTFELVDFLLRNLNFPALVQVADDRSGFPDINEGFDCTLEFNHGSFAEFNMDRLVNNQGEFNIDLYLSPVSASIAASAGLKGSIYRFSRNEAGNFMLEIDTSSTSQIGILYMDEDDLWYWAQPIKIPTSGSRLYWIDSGFPKTRTSPNEASKRIYRVYTY